MALGQLEGKIDLLIATREAGTGRHCGGKNLGRRSFEAFSYKKHRGFPMPREGRSRLPPSYLVQVQDCPTGHSGDVGES